KTTAGCPTISPGSQPDVDWLDGLWFFSHHGFKFRELMTRGLLLRRRGHRRRSEFGVLNGDVLLHLVDLNRKTIARARKRPTERNLHAAFVAVIGIVDLRGI